MTHQSTDPPKVQSCKIPQALSGLVTVHEIRPRAHSAECRVGGVGERFPLSLTASLCHPRALEGSRGSGGGVTWNLATGLDPGATDPSRLGDTSLEAGLDSI